jgi:hypothetical protein
MLEALGQERGVLERCEHVFGGAYHQNWSFDCRKLLPDIEAITRQEVAKRYLGGALHASLNPLKYLRTAFLGQARFADHQGEPSKVFLDRL